MSEPIIEGEEWKAIPGFEGRYSVSNLGRIMSHLSCRGRITGIMKPTKDPKGYLRIDLRSREGSSFTKKVHRLVAESFIPNPKGKPEVNHKNGVRNENDAENLEWATALENMTHSFQELGRKPTRGIQQASAKLTDAQIPEVRRLLRAGFNCREIGDMFGVTSAPIWYIKAGKHWRHVG